MGRKDKVVPVKVGEPLPLGAVLRQERTKKNMTLTMMANLVGYTKSYLSGVENGSSRPTPELVTAYERALDLEPDTLPRPSNGKSGHRHPPLSERESRKLTGRQGSQHEDSLLAQNEKKEKSEDFLAAQTSPTSPVDSLFTNHHLVPREDWGEVPVVRN